MPVKFQNMTRGAMRRLKVGQKITEQGITFERMRNGDGHFSVNIMVDGQRIHRVVGRESDGTTRTQAEEFIGQIRNDAKHDRLSLPKGRKTTLSFREASAKYLTKLEAEGGKDLRAKRTRLKLHLIPFFRNIPISRISTFDVERYKKKRRNQNAMKGHSSKSGPAFKNTLASPGTVNRELAVLSHLLNKALEWGWIEKHPARIRRFREDGGRITYLTVDQAGCLVDSAMGDSNWQIYPFIVIGLETSMRLTEILSIRKEHVYLDRQIIYIPNAKSGAREQPITKRLADYLQGHIAALPKDIPWLFPSPAARDGHTVNIRKPFRRVVAAAGLDPDQVVRHTLRHTAITHLVQAGVDLPTVKRISGHKTLSMVERYAHANGNHIRAAMDKLQSRYQKSPFKGVT